MTVPHNGILTAAGGVLWRQGAGPVEVLMVHRPSYDDWSLPKGKPRPNENAIQTAVREVIEETGLDFRVGPFLGALEYSVRNRPKRVSYWSMRLVGTESDPAALDMDEIDDFEWLSLDAARHIATYPSDSQILDRFEQVGTTAISVLLVRHARAGSRDGWTGPDRIRPLDKKGARQAQAIARTLPAFGPTQIFSADPLRCRETVADLSATLGIAVQINTAFDDASSQANPQRTLTAMQSALCDLDQVTVICSQGGTIEMLGALLAPTAASGTRKGAVWAFGCADGQVVTADYYPTLLAAR